MHTCYPNSIGRSLGDQKFTKTYFLDEKSETYQQQRHGVSVQTIAQRDRYTKTSVRPTVNQARVERIMQLALDFIPNPQFSRADAESIIMTATPPDDALSKTTRTPSGLPSYLASMYEVPLLTREQEVHQQSPKSIGQESEA